MTPDLSRDSFDPSRHFTRVIQQQGRVQLDADWNEQVSILLRYIRTFVGDLIGPQGGASASEPGSFAIGLGKDEKDPPLTIAEGHYYLDGLICANDRKDATYHGQPFATLDPSVDKLPDAPFLVYLDAWEREITCLEDDSIREIALGGADTAARAEVVWQVRAEALPAASSSSPTPSSLSSLPSSSSSSASSVSAASSSASPSSSSSPSVSSSSSAASSSSSSSSSSAAPASPPPFGPESAEWMAFLDAKRKSRGTLKARASAPSEPVRRSHCTPPSDAAFRGAENQLYRVEIHGGGKLPGTTAGTPGGPSPSPTPTFKWSRDNGSVAFAVTQLSESPDGGYTATLRDFGRDERRTLDVDDWVEFLDPYVLGRAPFRPDKPLGLLQVASVDSIDRTVVLKPSANVATRSALDPLLKAGVDLSAILPILRRWDQKDGVTRPPEPGKATDDPAGVVKVPAKGKWFDLEDGVQVQFPDAEAEYRAGDFWLIPARVVGNQVLWPMAKPGDPDGPEASLPPRGVDHSYAPLAMVGAGDKGNLLVTDLRSIFQPVSSRIKTR